MKVISHTSKNYAAELKKLDRRHVPSTELQLYVQGILNEVALRGDAAVLEFAEKFDGAKLTAKTMPASEREITAAVKATPAKVMKALRSSHKNVLAFSKRSLRKNWRMKNAQGAEIGEIYQPFQRVGIYVPGGSAPLVSTVLMTVTLAQAAGVPEIVVCTPRGKDGAIAAPMLAALKLCGATEVYGIGGAHAIAAMAMGTKSIPRVDKIMGPGNKFVVEAKRQLYGAVAIDLLPGPSEIMVIADDTAVPAYIAADLLAQAEHGKDSAVLMASPSLPLIHAVQRELTQQLASLPRMEIAQLALASYRTFVHTADLAQAIQLSNRWAPEHLSLIVKNEKPLLPLITSAGAIFVGNYSPVAAGDFMAGPSHTLPTGGAGKSFPGLTVDQFQRRTSIVKYSAAALRKSAPTISIFSEIEGLAAHGRSASIRLKK